MKNKIVPLGVSLLILLPLFPSTHAQGIPGYPESPSPRGGTSAGGPLLPGKTDNERWAYLQAQERTLLGKSKTQILQLFGKGGSGLKPDELVYQVTEWKHKDKKTVGPVIELTLGFVDDKVESYSLSLLHLGGQ